MRGLGCRSSMRDWFLPRTGILVVLFFGFLFPDPSAQQRQDAAAPILSALRSRDFAQALTLSRSALAANPGDFRIWTLRGMATAGTGDLAGALSAYQHALQLLSLIHI